MRDRPGGVQAGGFLRAEPGAGCAAVDAGAEPVDAGGGGGGGVGDASSAEFGGHGGVEGGGVLFE